jgi:hypothetical protein
MTDVAPASRTSRWIFVPAAVVIVLALAWSAFWWFAAQRAEATMATWVEQEAQRGRIHTCASRTVGGYPFRFEVRCTQPTMELTGQQPSQVVKAKDVVAVAQVYQPGLIIAEITGPVTIGEAGQPPVWQADWQVAQASLRGVPGRPERLSVVIDRLVFDQTGSSNERIGSADRLELHVRRGPGATDDKPVVEFAAQSAGAVVRVGPLGPRPIEAEINGVLRGVSDLRAKPMPERLREWQAAGGRLELTKLRLKQGDAVAVAAGSVGLTPVGRPDGVVDITMAGFDSLVREFVAERGGGRIQLGLLAGLAFLGRPAEIDGKRGIAMTLRINDGATFLGPIPLGRVDSLF